jgi:membrane protein implicated in regulation of membrane protease activity
MIFLKSDREFLNEMWEKVSQLEYEEIQIKAAKIRHKKVMIANVIITLSIIAAFVFFILAKPAMFAVYIITIVSLVLVYLLDKFISGENKKKSERVNLHEN